jgi:hypothetical protein
MPETLKEDLYLPGTEDWLQIRMRLYNCTNLLNFTKNHWTVYLQKVNCMIYNLNLYKIVKSIAVLSLSYGSYPKVINTSQAHFCVWILQVWVCWLGEVA